MYDALKQSYGVDSSVSGPDGNGELSILNTMKIMSTSWYMETLPSLLTRCGGNPPVTGESLSRGALK